MDYEKLKLDKQLCFRLYAASRLITQAYRPYLDKLGVTYPQYLVLMVLWETDELPVNDIAKRLALETNTVTPLIQRMEREGIVNRTKGKVDTRHRESHRTRQRPARTIGGYSRLHARNSLWKRCARIVHR